MIMSFISLFFMMFANSQILQVVSILEDSITVNIQGRESIYCENSNSFKGIEIKNCLAGNGKYSKKLFETLKNTDWQKNITHNDQIKAQMLMSLSRIEITCFNDPKIKSKFRNDREAKIIFSLSCKLKDKQEIEQEITKLFDFLYQAHLKTMDLATTLSKNSKTYSSLKEWLNFLSESNPQGQISSLFCDSPVEFSNTLNTKSQVKKINQTKGNLKVGHWIETEAQGTYKEGEYNEKGEKDGIWRSYQNNKLIQITKYNNGQIKMEEDYTGDYILKRTTNLDNGLVRTESFNSEGKIGLLEESIDNKKNGIRETYHMNGQISTKENYKNDELHGEQIYFHENGKIMSKENYIEGKVQSRKIFDENGLDITDEVAR